MLFGPYVYDVGSRLAKIGAEAHAESHQRLQHRPCRRRWRHGTRDPGLPQADGPDDSPQNHEQGQDFPAGAEAAARDRRETYPGEAGPPFRRLASLGIPDQYALVPRAGLLRRRGVVLPSAQAETVRAAGCDVLFQRDRVGFGVPPFAAGAVPRLEARELPIRQRWPHPPHRLRVVKGEAHPLRAVHVLRRHRWVFEPRDGGTLGSRLPARLLLLGVPLVLLAHRFFAALRRGL
mmetsp:Transcript_58791/g.164118  ORF Transcript_58791/g.164118 Transcript_58791/m.164118 type:complete len:234 (+) Transcript_58791:545-1246(+)